MLHSINVVSSNSSAITVYGDIIIDDNSSIIENNAGTISLSGDWVNNGSFTASSGYVKFFGDNELNTIEGNTSTTFSYLILNKNQKEYKLTLEINSFVTNDLIIRKGTLEVEDVTLEVSNNLNIFYTFRRLM